MEWNPIQQRLGVSADGIAGPQTYAALFRAAGCRDNNLALDMGRRASTDFPKFGISTPLRLAHFLAQAAHETMGFLYLKELGGPAYFVKMYDVLGQRPAVAKNLGNATPGDGARFPGRGIFQLTGRANYANMGPRIGVDLIAHPEKAADPANAVTIACLYWQDKELSALADADDLRAITKRINGGYNGFDDRKARLIKLKQVLGC